MKIAVIGAGGHGKVVADAILVAGGDEVFGFFDDDPACWGTAVLGFPVVGPIESVSRYSTDGFIVGIGENSARKRIFERLKAAGERPVTVVHPRATLGHGATLSEGVAVFANVVVNSDARIGANCILNTASTVDHDCILEPHCHIAPGVTLAGEVRLGEGVFAGTGAKIIPRVSIGRWAVIGAGAVVTRNVEDCAKVIGVPAKTRSK